MPELPEVQTIVNDLNKKVVGRRITGVWFDFPKIIKKPKPSDLEQQIKGAKILRVERRAKYIKIYLDGGRLLLIHQKLTGHLLVGKWGIRKAQPSLAARGTRKRPREYEVKSLIKGSLAESVNDYIHLIFYLDDGRMMGFSDLRKFGTVRLGKTGEIENLPELKNLGPDALSPSLSFNKFINLINSEKRKIKQVLMDQEIIAGIGNIYSDDILWMAKIHPFTPTYKLTAYQFKNLYQAMRKILQKAVKLRGTSTSDFRDTAGEKGGYTEARLAYQREGEPCRRCKTKIKRVKIGGRSAHFCPSCQKL
jgi:formamidopyrimidine-DNA glycosylase